MAKLIVQTWSLIMDHNLNLLKNIQDLQTRHLFMQILAWMWCVIFASSIGSFFVFGLSAIVHSLLIAGTAITVSTFEVARKQPEFFGGLGRAYNGEHE
tara:strand:- start:67 stop:360 length:294 start_codon:yes stop_codon:yes gene_type:complete